MIVVLCILQNEWPGSVFEPNCTVCRRIITKEKMSERWYAGMTSIETA